jgi:hypothetical protein
MITNFKANQNKIDNTKKVRRRGVGINNPVKGNLSYSSGACVQTITNFATDTSTPVAIRPTKGAVKGFSY